MGLLYFFLFGCLPHIPPHPPAPPSPLFARSVPLALLLSTSNCCFVCVFIARQPRFLHCLRCFFGALTCNRCPRTPPYLPASSLLFSYPCSLFLTGLRVSNPFLGGFGHPPPYPKPRSLPPQPILSLHFVCVLPSLCFISHSNSLLPLCSFSDFVGESLQKAHFLGDILP